LNSNLTGCSSCASSTSIALNGFPARERKPGSSLVRPFATSSRTISSVIGLPEIVFQITKPQPGSSGDFQVEHP
jgi:hypothetical protein